MASSSINCHIFSKTSFFFTFPCKSNITWGRRSCQNLVKLSENCLWFFLKIEMSTNSRKVKNSSRPKIEEECCKNFTWKSIHFDEQSNIIDVKQKLLTSFHRKIGIGKQCDVKKQLQNVVEMPYFLLCKFLFFSRIPQWSDKNTKN